MQIEIRQLDRIKPVIAKSYQFFVSLLGLRMPPTFDVTVLALHFIETLEIPISSAAFPSVDAAISV